PGTPTGSGTLVASDADVGAVLTWTGSAAGAYGSFAIAANGQWTYTLDNNLAVTQALTEGQSVTETFTTTVTDDKGAAATKLVTITVAGANDLP
ncbi:VCBS domain-containing protein, partial [Streptococcus suis]